MKLQKSKKLEKGDYISPVECEKALGISRDDAANYGFALMGLAKLLEKEHLKSTGKIIQVVAHNYGLQVLSDPEASPYNMNEIRKSIGKIKRNYDYLTAVDVSNLNENERHFHEKGIESVSRVVMFTEREVKKNKELYAPIPVDEPKLFADKKE